MTTSPIAQAINPSRAAAVDHAVRRAQNFVEVTKAELMGADMNLDLVAPMANRHMSREEYRQTLARYDFVNRITTHPATRRRSDALGFNADGIAQFLSNIATDAAADFDAYVAKLESKVGECATAEIQGVLWNESILSVTKMDGTVERWKTQMIINVSSFGKLFNQYPTRKLKK